MNDHLSRNPQLLDAIEEAPRIDISTSMWRMSHENHDPVACRKSHGRWDDGTFDVLYTSSNRDGAIAEVHYHLRFGQPVYPRKLKYRLIEMQVELTGVLDLSDKTLLESLGVDMSTYGRMPYSELKEGEYRLSQKIGEMALFHELPGIIAPSARSVYNNLLIICENAPPDIFESSIDHGIKEIQEWVSEVKPDQV